MVGRTECKGDEIRCGAPCLPETSLQGPGDPPAVWAAAASDSSEGWTGWSEGQIKDFKRNILPRRSWGVGKKPGCCFHFFAPPRAPALPQRQAGESLRRRKQVGGWVAVLPCPFPSLTFPHVGLIADKDEGDHPNNSFSPCSAHDRRCLQKHFAKIRDRSTSGGKMKVIGVPREEARPVVRISDQMRMCVGTHTTTITRSGQCPFSKHPLDVCWVQDVPSMHHQDPGSPHSSS